VEFVRRRHAFTRGNAARTRRQRRRSFALEADAHRALLSADEREQRSGYLPSPILRAGCSRTWTPTVSGPATGVGTVTVRLLDGTARRRPDDDDRGGRDLRVRGLIPGDYRVEFVRPNGTEFTLRDAGRTRRTAAPRRRMAGRGDHPRLGSVSENNDAGLSPRVVTGASSPTWMPTGSARRATAGGCRDRAAAGRRGQRDGQTTTTAADGTYRFDGLVPLLRRRVRSPDGTVFTPRTRGRATDSDADAGTGRTPAVTLVSGGRARTTTRSTCPRSCTGGSGSTGPDGSAMPTRRR
jgi:hypothetical protein